MYTSLWQQTSYAQQSSLILELWSLIHGLLEDVPKSGCNVRGENKNNVWCSISASKKLETIAVSLWTEMDSLWNEHSRQFRIFLSLPILNCFALGEYIILWQKLHWSVPQPKEEPSIFFAIKEMLGLAKLL